MKLPEGRLCRRRVVTDLATPLSRALEDSFTGYARLVPQDALLLDSDSAGILTFDRGIPVIAYHTGTGCGGTDALADIAVAGPYRVELYNLDREALATVHDMSELTVEPGTPAEQLAGVTELAQQTRDRAPDERVDQESSQHAVEAFLEDEERIAEIQDAARQEAQKRASEWGFDN
ncbi:hypothetical protein ACFQJ7_10175 [Halovenus rubra]|uniref:DUF8054 domain-containing protein n=2 Tax=Halovenus rubra TaxID=869890 RepID=A0ABD5X9C0_9EURY|nr:hypothetical protein [Halovenus rubra]